MSSVDAAAQLTAYLRGQLGALRRVAPGDAAGAQRAGTAGRAAAAPAKGSKAPGPSRQRPAEDLASAIARRVAAIDPADPDRRRKAFRVFLESLLLDEWGEQLINDPGFYQLVADVQVQMESDAGLRKLMDEASDRLLGPPAPG